ILIDDPSNKSGLQSLSQYPIFISKKNSYVFYDNKNIQNGVYERDNFYFEVYPYTIDSLDNFNKDALKFDGYFSSDDIFPPFEEQLRIMPDNSLGFIRSTPEDGFPTYKGKGKYHDKIHLSNVGLRGMGKLTYLTTTIISDEYLFLPDSMSALAKEFKIGKQKTGIQFPQVESGDVEIIWKPYEDILFANQTDKPYNIYNDSTVFRGDLTLRPTGLSGAGNLSFENAEYISNYFTYEADEFLADSSKFTLFASNKDTTLLTTNNVNSRYNFLNKTGDFETNEEIALIELPVNQYVGYVDEFKWKGKENLMTFKTQNLIHVIERGISKIVPVSQSSENPYGNHFISTKKSQDSLDFVSETAKFDISKRQIIADKVKFLKVADAIIYPSEGYLEVNERARMTTLEKAEVIANRENKLHRFYNAKINVLGKYSYKGSGDYTYVDVNYVSKKIHFDEIEVDDSIQTIARGVITEPDNFNLSPQFAFQGKVNLFANNPFMTFNGATQINHRCDFESNRWLRFEAEIDPANIYIPYPEKPRDINQVLTFSGDFITNDSVHIYTTFLGDRKVYSDNLMTPASGYLHYDRSRGEYVIASKEKILNRDTTGNLMSFNKDICIFHGEGNLNLGVEFHHFKVNQFGMLNHDLERNNTNLDLILTLNFHFSDPAMNIMAEEIDSLPGPGPINLTSKSYNKKLNEFIGIEDANILKEEMVLYGSYRKLPDEFDSDIIISDLKLRWNPETKSYVSKGKIGIAIIGKRQIHKAVEGHIEIIKKRSGDIFHMYLKINNKNWYFLTYTRGVLQVLSSNDEFNTIIKETKPKHRKYKAPHSSMSYIYILSTDEKYKRTLSRLTGEGEIIDDEKLIDEEIQYLD
ncbi:hypothetical protein ACFLTE_05790, partial [Bacteroidota bacterium]